MTAIQLARRNFETALTQFKAAPAREKGFYAKQLRLARYHMEHAEKVVIRDAMPYGRNGHR